MPYILIDDVLCEIKDQCDEINKLLENGKLKDISFITNNMDTIKFRFIFSDDSYTYAYIAKNINKSSFKFERPRVASGMTCTETTTTIQNAFQNDATKGCSSTPNEAQTDLLHDQDETLTTDSTKWSTSATQLLVCKRLEYEEKFTSGTSSKKTLWNKISTAMKASGYNFDGDLCDNKFRGILATYKRNIRKRKSTGESKIVWPYFEAMDEVYGSKNSINVPKERLLSSGSSSTTISPSSSPSPISSADVEDAQLALATTIRLNNRSKRKRKEDFDYEDREVINRHLKVAERRNELLEQKVKASVGKNELLKQLIATLSKKSQD